MINSFFYSFIQMIYSVIRIFPSVPWSERATKNCLGFRYFITLYLMNPSCIKSQLSECGCITSKTYSFLRLRLKAICCCFSITLKQHLWISLLEIILWYLQKRYLLFLFSIHLYNNWYKYFRNNSIKYAYKTIHKM